MEQKCFLDIETIPTQSPEKRADFLEGVRPPGNIKKQESIEKWLSENKEGAAAEAIAKTSFDPADGHICTIAWAINDGEPEAAHAETVDQERDILAAFFGALRPFYRYDFFGHYISGFDIRFILCRAVALGVKIPRSIPRDPKSWDKKIFDTMTAWAGPRGTISMDDLCGALGIEGKGDFTGADVAAAWERGDHDKIIDYCKDDVIRTRQIVRRFEAVDW